MNSSQIFEKLYQKFGRHIISVYEAAREIKKDWTDLAVRTAICKGRFPLPTFKVAGENMVKLSDLAAFLADPDTTFAEKPTQIKRRRGRPTNAERMLGGAP